MTERFVVGSLLLFSSVVFLLAPVRQHADSHYALLQSERLYRHGHVRLNECFPPPPLDPRRFPGLMPHLGGWEWWDEDLPYQIERTSSGDLLYRYGPGTSMLSIPAVALFNLHGVSTVGSDGLYDVRADQWMQTVLAAFVSAGLALALYGLARQLLTPPWALVVALGAAFASPVLSTASRTLWSHTWGTLLLTSALALVVRSEIRGAPPPGVLLGTLLSFAVFVRPANAIHALVLGGFVLLRRPRPSWRLGATALVGAACGVAWSWQTRGVLLPDAYRGRRLSATDIPGALLGHLVSPSRGLLLFCPLVIVAAWLAWRYARSPEARRLLALSLVAITSHLLLVSTVPRWWGGHSFGPRLLTELVPWWLLVAALGLQGVRLLHERLGRAPPGWKLERAVLVLTLTWGLFVHGRGATAVSTWTWNSLPKPVDEAPERVWSWHEPQFLAGLWPPRK